MSYGLDTSKPPILVIRFVLPTFTENDLSRALNDPELTPDALASYAGVAVDLTNVREKLSTNQLVFLLCLYHLVRTQPLGAIWNRPGDVDDQLRAIGGFICWKSVAEARRQCQQSRTQTMRKEQGP